MQSFVNHFSRWLCRGDGELIKLYFITPSFTALFIAHPPPASLRGEIVRKSVPSWPFVWLITSHLRYNRHTQGWTVVTRSRRQAEEARSAWLRVRSLTSMNLFVFRHVQLTHRPQQRSLNTHLLIYCSIPETGSCSKENEAGYGKITLEISRFRITETIVKAAHARRYLVYDKSSICTVIWPFLYDVQINNKQSVIIPWMFGCKGYSGDRSSYCFIRLWSQLCSSGRRERCFNSVNLSWSIGVRWPSLVTALAPLNYTWFESSTWRDISLFLFWFWRVYDNRIIFW